MLTLNPKYESLRTWLEQLPDTFFQQGEVIYDARNQIRVIDGPDGKRYNVKRYCCPIWINRIVYTWFRSPKAVRAYYNALVLQQKGIATPEPIGYILCGKTTLRESFLITEQIPLAHRLYEWGDGVTEGREDAMRSFGRFTANMHNQDILHLDYSPGNILYDGQKGKWEFSVVDINRMHFGKVSIETGCANMGRLWGEEPMYRFIAEGYAAERHADSETCYRKMWQAHQDFWSKHKKPKEYTQA